MTLTIRHAESADLSTLVEIERGSFPAPYWLQSDFERYLCLVALVDAQIAGFLVSRQTSAAAPGSYAEREILNIAVAPLFRGLGVATALLRHELQHEADFFLEVRESNLPAQQLYQKFHFTELGRRPGYYDSPQEAAIVMGRKWC